MTLTAHYEDHRATVYHGDCLDVMAAMPADSVDAIVTDPPYGLGFMGKQWDSLPPGKDWAEACLRVLKPGGHLVAFGGSRTWHRLTVAIEDGGFEIRDSLAWIYGSGFPKSQNIAKAIDKQAGARGHVGKKFVTAGGDWPSPPTDYVDPPLVTPEAKQWEGWGTALKPAFEPIVLARKPLAGTVAANMVQHGTGGINIDACRIGDHERTNPPAGNKPGGASLNMSLQGMPQDVPARDTTGRWPANVLLDEQTAAEVDRQSGVSKSSIGTPRGAAPGDGWGMTATGAEYDDEGGASRFFFCAKDVPARDTTGRWPANVLLDEQTAAEVDRQSGITVSRPTKGGTYTGTRTAMEGGHMDNVPSHHDDEGGASRFFFCAKAPKSERPRVNGVSHPTVKPLQLMRWLVQLVARPGGLVLDTFAGSGTTMEACLQTGHRAMAIEQDETYLPLILSRIDRDNGMFDLGAL